MAVEQGERILYNRYDTPSSHSLAREQEGKVLVRGSSEQDRNSFEAQGDRADPIK